MAMLYRHAHSQGAELPTDHVNLLIWKERTLRPNLCLEIIVHWQFDLGISTRDSKLSQGNPMSMN